MIRITIYLFIAFFVFSSLKGKEDPSLIKCQFLSKNILVVHVDEGYVIHHLKGQKRNQEKVVSQPLDAMVLREALRWKLVGDDEDDLSNGQNPVQVGLKSKGTDFAWLVESWDQKNNRAINKSIDHAKEHWFYLVFEQDFVDGVEYELRSRIYQKAVSFKMVYDNKENISEAVHVNLIGYSAKAERKAGFIFHWAGDLGGLDFSWLKESKFSLVRIDDGQKVFEDNVVFKAKADQAETFQAKDTPQGNFLGSDVWLCDFSSYDVPGEYRLVVEGVGASQPFEIGEDVMRKAFYVTSRGLYHNRSGIALAEPYTEYTRPAPHHPQLTKGFAGKLVYTKERSIDFEGETYPGGKEKLEEKIVGSLDDVWGWYQDAGDWDGYLSHMKVPAVLLFAYELKPKQFYDNELNIPESGNGLPDILDEAAWLLHYGYRLRHSLLRKKWGTGGLGLRVSGDDFGNDGEGVPSYEDVHRKWVVYGEDPISTFAYAGACAHYAYCIKKNEIKGPNGTDWLKEAEEAFVWALKNTREGDETKEQGVLRAWRNYAAINLYRLFAKEEYLLVFKENTETIKENDLLWQLDFFAPACLALLALEKEELASSFASTISAVNATVDKVAIETPQMRAIGWGGNPWVPMLVGQQTTPWVLEAMIGEKLYRSRNPEKARLCTIAVQASCDYVLGCNSLNMTWVTGLGSRYPKHVFHMDAWYNRKGKFHPGIIPYGPWRKDLEQGQGPWDKDWPNATLYPAIDQWPGNERWYDNRCSPMNSEFTVHQNTCYAAAAFAWLCEGKSE